MMYHESRLILQMFHVNIHRQKILKGMILILIFHENYNPLSSAELPSSKFSSMRRASHSMVTVFLLKTQKSEESESESEENWDSDDEEWLP